MKDKLNVVNPFYERVGRNYLARKKEEVLNPVVAPTPLVSQQENKSVLTKDDYIFVPRLGFYVAKERSYLGSDFNECQELLHKENAKMLNLNEMREFLIYAKESERGVYSEILEIKRPRRSEWIDANFKMYGDDLYVQYHFFDFNKKIIPLKNKLDKDTLMNNEGISLHDWLNNSTQQGLPKNSKGDFFYRAPMKDNDSVAWIYSGADMAILGCNGDPSYRSPSLGVRKCFARLEDIK